MKNLKFRIWTPDEEGKCFLNPDFFNVTLDGKVTHIENGAIDKTAIIQQFTGLKDKNDKEIYEGDIIRQENPRFSFQVKFGILTGDASRIRTGFYLSALQYNDNTFDFNQENDEIIGNIFENPELLKN